MYRRVSGTKGLEGEWQGESLQASNGQGSVIVIEADGSDGLAFTLEGFNASVKARLDGRDYPFTGPMFPPNYTAALKCIDARTLQFDEKQAGKPTFTRRLQLSPDSKTLHMTYTAADGSKPFADVVYER